VVWQEPGEHIYWISIAAVYPDVQVDYPWGWKTRPHDPESPAPDDAGGVYDPTALHARQCIRPGWPISGGRIVDMAFALTTIEQQPGSTTWATPRTAPTIRRGHDRVPAGVPAIFPTVYMDPSGAGPYGPLHLNPHAVPGWDRRSALEWADIGLDQDLTNNIIRQTTSRTGTEQTTA